jgi:DNA repair protein RadC
VHNHPSGIEKPSEADIAITRQIVAAGKILGIGVLDHVVVTKQKFESVPVDYS